MDFTIYSGMDNGMDLGMDFEMDVWDLVSEMFWVRLVDSLFGGFCHGSWNSFWNGSWDGFLFMGC